MRLKALLIASLMALAARVSSATPTYVQLNPSSTQSGSYIVQGATVTQRVTLPFLSTGSYVLTDSQGNLTTNGTTLTNFIQNTNTHQPNSALNVDTVTATSLSVSSLTVNGPILAGGGLTAGTSGQMLISRGSALSPFWTSGRILQIVQYTITTTSNVTTAFSGFINSPVQPQITPLSTGSTIYIFGSIESNVHNVAAGTGVASLKWTRGLFGTNLHASYGDWAGGGSGTSVANDTWRQGPLFDWDSPASLSQQTYVVQFECNGTGGASTCYVNEASFVTPASTVFLVEIGP